jgi:DNA-binding transcriptional MerR regulator
MAKSRDAFRTISEVSDWLDTPAHVLRFWESKFSQIKPIKRAGGRRYYRPEDMELLGGIKTLLHDQGMTIKGVQKLLREQGIKHVAAMGPSPMDDDEDRVIDSPKAVDAEEAPQFAAPEAPGPAPTPAKPRLVAKVPADPEDSAFTGAPRFAALLSSTDPVALRRVSHQIAPLVARLEALRERAGAS